LLSKQRKKELTSQINLSQYNLKGKRLPFLLIILDKVADLFSSWTRSQNSVSFVCQIETKYELELGLITLILSVQIEIKSDKRDAEEDIISHTQIRPQFIHQITAQYGPLGSKG